MNFKSLQSFFITHRQIIFVIVGVFCLFVMYASPVFAQGRGGGAAVVAGQTAVANGQTANFDPIGGFIGGALAYMFYGIALGIGGMVAGLGGVLLDLSIGQVVLDFGKNVGGNSGLGEAVRDLWVVMRDFCNILFIFSLVYLGIRTILNSEDSETRKKLGLLIIAALLINFSLYISQVIIDFTNIVATQVFNQITSQDAFGVPTQNNDSFTGALLDIGNNTVTGAFLDVASVTTFFGKIPDGMDAGKVLIFAIFMMIFLIIVGVVFAMGAFLLITRFIALLIYMILSPLMFAGWIFPKFAQHQEKWWGGFLKQAFFAPAFFFMLYLSLVVLQKMRGALNISGDTKFTDMVAPGTSLTPNIFTLILFLIVAIGFLYASIKVGEMMGVAGAKGALSLTQKAIGGATVGLAARVGRSVIGSRAFNMAKDEDGSLRHRIAEGGVDGAIAKMQLEAAHKVANSSFDVRNAGAAPAFLGQGTKGGYKTRLEETAKRDSEFAKLVGQVKEDDVQVNYLTQEKEALEHKLRDLKHSKDHIIHEDLTDLKDELKDLKADKDAATTAEEKKRLSKAVTEKEEAIKTFEAKEKAKIDEKIHDLEMEIKEQDIAINQEKNRYITGSYVSVKDNPQYTDAKDKIKRAKHEFAHSIDPVFKLAQAEIIRAENKRIKDLKREAKKSVKGGLGFAGTREEAGWVESAFLGRTRNQNRNSGKELRKEYEKADKGAKDDAHGGHAPAAHPTPAAAAPAAAGGGGAHH